MKRLSQTLHHLVKLSKPNCDIMRDWASAYGAAVRQRTVRQETTIAKHGTLPEYIYQRHCIRSDQPINIKLEEADQDEEDGQESEGPGEDSQTEEQVIEESGSEPEYDGSSDEDDKGASDESGNYLQGEIGSFTTFLLGTRSRFGSTIRFNNRLIQ